MSHNSKCFDIFSFHIMFAMWEHRPKQSPAQPSSASRASQPAIIITLITVKLISAAWSCARWTRLIYDHRSLATFIAFTKCIINYWYSLMSTHIFERFPDSSRSRLRAHALNQAIQAAANIHISLFPVCPTSIDMISSSITCCRRYVRIFKRTQ